MQNSSSPILIFGGDGYLGWSLGLALAARTDHHVVLIDNLSKRAWERQAGVTSLIPLEPPRERVRAFTKHHGRNNLSYEFADLSDFDSVYGLIAAHRPATVVNAAQQPSAPFSMLSPDKGMVTFTNNAATSVNTLWAISMVDPAIRYIAMGSAGAYQAVDAELIPRDKVNLSFHLEGKDFHIANSWIPMHASDFYHQSKIQAFLINDLCAALWGLRIITVQQSTIFGHAIEENTHESAHELLTRFNYDCIFGTVINRFICQSAIGHPLTVYGSGSQTTGLISLQDTVENLLRLVELPLEPGRHLVQHSFTQRMSILDMAQKVAALTGASIETIDNPRLEPDASLNKDFDCSGQNLVIAYDTEAFQAELASLFKLAFHYRKNIDPRWLTPGINWSNSIQNSEIA